jgi:hypothetical protein
METKFDLVQILILIGLVTMIVLMFAVWLETRRLREVLHEFLLSSRENSRSLMAAIHEVGASLIRERKSESLSDKRSRDEVD